MAPTQLQKDIITGNVVPPNVTELPELEVCMAFKRRQILVFSQGTSACTVGEPWARRRTSGDDRLLIRRAAKPVINLEGKSLKISLEIVLKESTVL